MIWVNDSGEIQIPKYVRVWLDIQPGDSVEISVENGAIIIRRIESCVTENS